MTLWPELPLAVLTVATTYGFAPGLALHLCLLIYPKNHDRRAELTTELRCIPFLKRPFWVSSMVPMCLTEGASARITAVKGVRKVRLDAAESARKAVEEDARRAKLEAEAAANAQARRTRARAERAATVHERPSNTAGFADTDWFTDVDDGEAISTSILDEDFRAWRSEFPDFYELPVVDENAYSGSLAITDSDIRVALGPQADELMAAANVDVDELVRLVNATTGEIRLIADEPAAGRKAVKSRSRRRGRHRK